MSWGPLPKFFGSFFQKKNRYPSFFVPPRNPRSPATEPTKTMDMPPTPGQATPDIVVRLTHWIGAAAMIIMILSGWQIYNASPILPFTFPRWITLGGWLGAGIAWHIAAMWVLIADGLVYLAWGVVSGHFQRDLLPVSPAAVARDFSAALRLRLRHDGTSYNAVQKVLYAGVILAAVLAVLTGLSIWKPVQLHWLSAIFGGYPVARVLHFALMSAITAFLVIHVTLVAIVPSTLRRMTIGARRGEVRP
jgi:thiosulfate reductase cytochrome b subunit